jgi:hypothetical protein
MELGKEVDIAVLCIVEKSWENTYVLSQSLSISALSGPTGHFTYTALNTPYMGLQAYPIICPLRTFLIAVTEVFAASGHP